MLCTMLLLGFSTMLLAGPALAAATETHSGIVAAVDLGRHALALQEMGPWAGPGTGTVPRTITLAPDTPFELVRRSSGSTPGGWPGGYVESRLRPEQIHAGDFATVRVTRRGRQVVAVSIDVVPPSGG
jgi:hypothetical protein